MLDSGSEANIIKIGLLPDPSVIDKTKIYMMNGIGNTSVPAIGIVKLKIANIPTEFLVVPNTFPIPFSGILGTEFFLENDSLINFDKMTLKIKDYEIKMWQITTPHFIENEDKVNKIEVERIKTTLPVIEVFIPLTETVERFLVDSGAESNLIKIGILPPDIEINIDEPLYLVGIGPKVMPTLGCVELKILGVSARFLVVEDNFQMPENGLLGAEFFTKANATINFKDQKLEANNKSTPLHFNRLELISSNSSICAENGSITSSVSLSSLPENYLKDFDVTDYLLDRFFDSISDKYEFLVSSLQIYEELNIIPEESDYLLPVGEVIVGNKNKLIFNIQPRSLFDLLDTSEFNTAEKEHIRKLIELYKDEFYLDGDKLPGTSVIVHRIPTVDNEPINARQYKFPHALREEMCRQAEELENQEIIQSSNSPYNTPVWIVPKKPDAAGNPRWRMVLDFRQLNEKTISDAYPMPNILEIFDLIGRHGKGAKYYTCLDLASGFHQIKMSPEDAHKTAFSTPYGHYEFVRMPFGLKNAPATFQRFMDEILRGLQGEICFVYIDDIIIFADSLEQHEKRFKLVMERLKQAQLKVQLEKCQFLQKRVSFLGHILSEDGIRPDSKKIEAVKDFPVPKSVKNIRQFLGLAGYYRRFIKDFAHTAKPLSNLTKKDVKFSWGEKAQNAFDTLKDALCKAPVLQFPDLSKPYNITCDASGYAVGGVLSQGEIGKDRPIAYTSRVLRGPELAYEVYEKEALAIIHSVKTFRSYIYGRKITIITDHQPLIWFKTADLNTRVQKWRFQLAEYDYNIIYKPGKLNLNADALSRNPPTTEINVVTRAQKELLEKSRSVILKQPTKPIDKNTNLEPKKRGRPRKNLITIQRDPENAPVQLESNIEQKNQQILNDDEDETFSIPSIPKISRKLQTPSTIDASSEESCESISFEKEDQCPQKRLFVQSKDLIEFRTDNIIYFMTSNNEPCDVGARKLLEHKKIRHENPQLIGEVILTKDKRHKNYFSLCIKGEKPESLSQIKENIYSCLLVLRALLIKHKIELVSIGKSEYIEGLEWREILSLIEQVFKNCNIKFIVCTGKLDYVPLEKRDAIFYEYHKSPIGGHRGVTKTYNRIKHKYYWEGLKDDIQRRIQQCLECQLKKLVRLKTRQPMIITETPATTFEKVAMDIVGPLKRTQKGHEYVLTLQDQLSKFCIAVPLQNTLAITIADAFIKRLICVFGSPKSVLTDQGQNFLSTLMKQIAK